MGIFGQWTLWRNLVLLSDHECSPAILSLSHGNIDNVRITRDNWDKKVRLMDIDMVDMDNGSHGHGGH